MAGTELLPLNKVVVIETFKLQEIQGTFNYLELSEVDIFLAVLCHVQGARRMVSQFPDYPTHPDTAN